MMALGRAARSLIEAGQMADVPSPATRRRVRRALHTSVAAGAATAAVVAVEAALGSVQATVSAMGSGAALGAAKAASSSAATVAAGGGGALSVVNSVGAAGVLGGSVSSVVAPATVSGTLALMKGPVLIGLALGSAAVSAPVVYETVTAGEGSSLSVVSRLDSGPVSVTAVASPGHVLSEATPVATASVPLLRARSRSDSDSSATPRLSEEARWLSPARKALAVGRASDALEWLRQYDARFPRGALREEARATRAMALCMVGDAEGRRAALNAFERGHAGSPLLARVRDACGKER